MIRPIAGRIVVKRRSILHSRRFSGGIRSVESQNRDRTVPITRNCVWVGGGDLSIRYAIDAMKYAGLPERETREGVRTSSGTRRDA